MKRDNSISTSTIYDLVNQTRRELSESIIRLEGKFDLLEAGRVSSIEKQVANVQGRMAITAVAVSIFISVAIGVIPFILRR